MVAQRRGSDKRPRAWTAATGKTNYCCGRSGVSVTGSNSDLAAEGRLTTQIGRCACTRCFCGAAPMAVEVTRGLLAQVADDELGGEA
jgi:hypothetical protein